LVVMFLGHVLINGMMMFQISVRLSTKYPVERWHANEHTDPFRRMASFNRQSSL
jgi:hypothetical protein